MIRRPPRSTRTGTLLPYTTLFRSVTARLPLVHGTNGRDSGAPRRVTIGKAPFTSIARSATDVRPSFAPVVTPGCIPAPGPPCLRVDHRARRRTFRPSRACRGGEGDGRHSFRGVHPAQRPARDRAHRPQGTDRGGQHQTGSAHV